MCTAGVVEWLEHTSAGSVFNILLSHKSVEDSRHDTGHMTH